MTLKFIFTTFTFFSAIIAAAQSDKPNMPIDSLTNRITYTEVVYVDSTINKLELYSRAREWFAKTYKSSTNVLQMDDKESGKLVGKALMHVYHRALGSDYKSGYVNYTISVYLKDGRYKYEITDFFHTGEYVGDGNRIPDYGACELWIDDQRKYPLASKKSIQKISNYYLSQLDTNIKSLILDLKSEMNKPASKNSKENW